MPLHTVRLSVRRLACTYLSPPDAGVVRSYPNFTSRLHFLPMSSTKANGGTWLPALPVVRTGGGSSHAVTELSSFSVVRPLPSASVGRTVLPASATRPPKDSTSVFSPVRSRSAHLAGFTLITEGVPFQQQDHGVSA
jgi:hypothetical protein